MNIYVLLLQCYCCLTLIWDLLDVVLFYVNHTVFFIVVANKYAKSINKCTFVLDGMWIGMCLGTLENVTTREPFLSGCLPTIDM